jgi:transcriptional regulator GlxA family with amidase domain
MLTRTDQIYRTVVDQTEIIGRLHEGEPLHIPFICKSCNVTERTLRSAFKAILGTTPYRYLRTLRMTEARRALMNAEPGTTVTLVAMQFGFLELGRFSGEYKTTFGERPSDTLRTSTAAGRGHAISEGNSPAAHAP